MSERYAEDFRRRVRELYFEGMTQEAVAKVAGCSEATVSRVVRELGRPGRKRREGALTEQEREAISRGLSAGDTPSSIARQLGRHRSTVSREVAAQGGPKHYRAWRGEQRAAKLAARPKPRKLEKNRRLARYVTAHLERDWSPEQIAEQLRQQYPQTAAMQVSHETIYQSLYVQGRGALRKELTRHLRTRRKARRSRDGRARDRDRGRIKDMVNISQRPAEVADRAVPGHWEGDLVMGKGQRSAIATLVERSTRFVMLVRLANGKSAEHVRQALTKKITKLPATLRRSLTWDQGKELAQHVRFTVDTGVQVYFCDPHSPWQRGSNENTNGLLRQYFPKGMDLSSVTTQRLDVVARKLNGRPRQTLGWRSPSQALAELLR